MNTLRLALRMLRRDWHAGELRVLALAVVVAVAAVSSVGLFTDRVRQALAQQANELLGADAVIAADHRVPLQYGLQADVRGLAHTEVLELLSMVYTAGRNQLAEVKAVGPGYPLRGELRLAPQPYAADAPAHAIPARGSAWADARLINELGLTVGDSVQVGNSPLHITSVITYEPDRGGALFNIAPRLLINLADLDATDLLQPGSRARYRLLVAGREAQVADYRAAMRPQLGRGEQLESAADARPELRTALDRARQFLGLASLVSVTLAGVAIATAARRFVERHLDTCAVLRCLGATQGTILSVYLMQMVWLGLGASAVGIVIGYAGQWALVNVLGELAMAGPLPVPGLAPVWAGLLVGLVTLLGFAAPPLMHLGHVPTLRVLRKELGALPPQGWSTYGLGLAVLAALMVWQAGELRLAGLVLAGLVGTVLVLAGVAYGLVWILARAPNSVSALWRFGLANIHRHRGASVTQMVAFGLGVMVLLVLGLVRVDMLKAWQASLPPDAPNRFMINIQPDQVQAVEEFFARAGRPRPALYPMVRGRLVAINGRAISPERYADERARRLVEREFNLSWASVLPQGNHILAGQWWTAADNGRHVLSIEEGIAKTVGIRMSDTLTYDIAGEPLEVKVANLRKVAWDSFRVNFFVIAPPGVLENYPASYITALYLPPRDYPLLGAFVQQFPNITVIDVAAIMDQVRAVMARVSRALEYVFLFTLAAGLVVLYAAIQGTLDERIRENAVLRALGADRRRLLRGMIAEFGVLGGFAGLIAASAASILGYMLAARVFDFPYHFNPWLWLTGIVGGALAVGIVGFIGTRPVLRRPPWETLREV